MRSQPARHLTQRVDFTRAGTATLPKLQKGVVHVASDTQKQ